MEVGEEDMEVQEETVGLEILKQDLDKNQCRPYIPYMMFTDSMYDQKYLALERKVEDLQKSPLDLLLFRNWT